jgi:flagellar motor switch protein FliN/FliY
MADEELLDGNEEQENPEAGQDKEQDSAPDPDQESDASEPGAEAAAEEQDQSDVAVDQEEPSQDAEVEQPHQKSEGEADEDESVDDLAEQQMLAELEKLESEEGGETIDEQAAAGGEEQDVQRPEFPSFGQTTSASEQKNLDLLLDVNLPISIELGRTSMKIKEILGLGPGSVVELKKLAGEPVDLLVNSKIVAKGEVVVVDENFGLRITSLLSPEERLRSLE